MLNRLAANWASICRETSGSDHYWRLAVDHVAIKRILLPLIERHATGTIIDAGAGMQTWRPILLSHGTQYLALDIESRRGIDIACDLQMKIPLPDQIADTIFCCSVLEHMPMPGAALREMYRLLKPEGRLILAVPFIYYLHGAPHDYYRFSPFGIRWLTKDAGFDIIEIGTGGGIAHFLLQVTSIISTSLLWSCGLRRMAMFVAELQADVASFLDRWDREGRMAQTVTVVLRRAS